MATLPKEHKELYFDKLIRTQKSESLLALIMASHYSEKCLDNDKKSEIAKRLVDAYNLFRDCPKGTNTGAGTYIGSDDQFASQYTLGHEMAIWRNSDLNLTSLAKKVAENYITIRQYLDIIFLNYIQPVDGKIIHPLYLILSYMKKNGIDRIPKSDFINALGVAVSSENSNALFNFLKETDYFTIDKDKLVLNSYFDVNCLIDKCNKKYLNDNGYRTAQIELSNSDKYEEYISNNCNFVIETTNDLNLNSDVSEDYLVSKLIEMINNNDKVLAIHLFGIVYGKIIKNNNYSIKDIISKAKLQDSYFVELNKGIKLSSYVALKDKKQIELIDDKVDNNHKTKYCYNNFCSIGINLIVYGTPGCGKSYYVKNELLPKYGSDLNGIPSIRTTFYQDYTNTDFVGQIMPVVKSDGSAIYKFNPGPFTLALNLAIQNPDKPIALVIEELNRGNAASIFGDIFQLLDRENGLSVYNITNVNIQKYLENENPDYKFDYIKLPSNLSIICTMNTSDQNVFTLDTAFKRRWKFEKIKNSFETNHKFKNYFIPGMDVDWEDFCNSINQFILDSKDDITNSEDKQIGVYFVSKDGLRVDKSNLSNEDQRKEFAFKIFEYLWDDVAKYSHDSLFKDVKSLDELIDKYVSLGANDINGIQVFNDNIIKRTESKYQEKNK